ncbi:hypothetical protein C8R43DRAFT_962899 [Mycena crocata]|nr:hypothetical protein C8R43DRAFT_962899 [Mycena crocata]
MDFTKPPERFTADYLDALYAHCKEETEQREVQLRLKKQRRQLRRTLGPFPMISGGDDERYPLRRTGARQNSTPAGIGRWSLRKSKRPGGPRSPTAPGKALFDTPVASEDESDGGFDTPQSSTSSPKSSRGPLVHRGAQTQVRVPNATLTKRIVGGIHPSGTNSDVNSSVSHPILRLPPPPSLLRLVRPSPSPLPTTLDSDVISVQPSIPPPPSASSAKGRCSNCHSTWTSNGSWAYSSQCGGKQCHACDQYERKNHRLRPLSLIQRNLKRQCSKCHNSLKSGTWMGNDRQLSGGKQCIIAKFSRFHPFKKPICTIGFGSAFVKY